jgi:hypothetical protein
VVLVVRGSSCEILGVQAARGLRGVNHVRFSGRLHGRPLAPGRYSITIEVVRGRSRMPIARIGVEIVRPDRRLTRGQRAAPVAIPTCRRRPGRELAALVFAGAVPGVDSLDGVKPTSPSAASAPFKPPNQGSALGVGAPPRVHLPGSPFSFGWLLSGLLIGVLGVAGAVFVLYTVRFLNGSWNP